MSPRYVAVRDNERGAAAYAVPVVRAKLTGFALSGFLAAVAGCLLVHINQGYSEGPFVVTESIGVFTAAVVGGLGSLAGAVLGHRDLGAGDRQLREQHAGLDIGARDMRGVVVIEIALRAGGGAAGERPAGLLGAAADKLLAHYRDNPGFIAPETRRNEVVSFVSGGLDDLSISRTSMRARSSAV